MAVIVKIDQSCQMASVYWGDEGMCGNFWDFYNGCHGMYNLPSFSSYDQLAQILAEKHKEQIVYDRQWRFEK